MNYLYLKYVHWGKRPVQYAKRKVRYAPEDHVECSPDAKSVHNKTSTWKAFPWKTNTKKTMTSKRGTAFVVPVDHGCTPEGYSGISISSTVIMRPSYLHYRLLLPAPNVSRGEASWYPKSPARR